MTNNKLYKLLGMENDSMLKELDEGMSKITDISGALERLENDNNSLIEESLRNFGVRQDPSAEEVIDALSAKAEEGDSKLYSFLDINRDDFDFQKVADAARDISTVSKNNGFFLKKE